MLSDCRSNSGIEFHVRAVKYDSAIFSIKQTKTIDKGGAKLF